LLRESAKAKLQEFVLTSGGINALAFDGTSNPISLFLHAHETQTAVKKGFSYELSLRGRAGFGNAVISKESLTKSGRDKSQKVTTLGAIVFRDEDKAFVIGGAKNRDLNAKQLEVIVESLVSGAGGFAAGNRDVDIFRAYLLAMKTYQYFETSKSSIVRAPNLTSYETTLQPGGQNLISFLHTQWSESRDFKQCVDAAMKAAFGEEYEELVFAPASDRKIQLRIRWKSLKNPVSATDLSDGTLRFLFLVSALVSPQPPTLLVMDEPEIGLHPRMLPIIAELAADASQRTQIIFMTHSPEFLDAFDQDVDLTTTICELVYGKTTLRNVSDEDLRHWLKDYSLGEMFRSGTLEGMA
jgi:predicted ATPase